VTSPEPHAPPPWAGGGKNDAMIAALNAALNEYEVAVSQSVIELRALMEELTLIGQEAAAHPERSWGTGGAGRAQAIVRRMDVIYQRLARLGAPTTVQG
jgi:hypothetical protein